MKKLTTSLALIFCCALQSYSAVIYVDYTANANGDGSSWNLAFKTIQDALAAASSGDEIWVASGFYTTSLTDDPNESFEIPCGVSLFGGFAGWETERQQRDWTVNQCSLSGNLGSVVDDSDNALEIITITNCEEPVVINGFGINSATGGAFSSGIEVNDCEDVTIANCEMLGHSTQFVVRAINADLQLRNCLIADNDTGVVLSMGGGTDGCEVLNSTIVNNNAEIFFSSSQNSPLVVRNSIFWEFGAAPFGSSVCDELSNSIILGSYLAENESAVLEADPLFVNQEGGDYQLVEGSPAEDAGNQSFINQGYDLARSYRIMGSSVDMGCFERRLPTVLYVDQDATGLNTGLSWNNAFTDLAEAIEVSVSGDELWVAEGTYVAPDVNGFTIQDKAIEVFGGFAGTETQRNQRDWFEHRTILNGNLGDPAIDSDNATQVVYVLVGTSIPGELVLNGLEIEDGFADNSSSGPAGNGGGMYILQANNVIIRNCVFRDNYTQNNGGALYIGPSESVLVSQCSFINNDGEVGSAVYSANNTFENDRSIDIQSCLFNGNSALNTGTVYLNQDDSVELTNCTFYANGVSFTPNAKIIDADGTDESWVFANNILWQNNILGANQEILDAGPNSIVANSILQNAYSGNATNVFNLDPQFVDPSGGDFSLAQGSPAINNGDGSYVQENLDLLRQPRVLNGAVDLGAIENEIIVDGVIYVDQDATGNNDGSSWSNAFNEVGDAVDASQPGNQIWIAEGIYTPEAPNFQPWQLENDVDIIGGFQGIEWEVSSADPAQYETVISGDIGLDGDTSNDEMAMMQMFDLSSFVKISGLIFEEMNNTGPNMNPVCFFNNSQAAVGSIGEVLFERCVFRDSQLGSEQFVGAQASSASPIILQMDNCLIGGGISNDAFLLTLAGSIVLRMNHCTMNYNSSNVAILAGSTTPIEINNSILWNEQGVNVWSNSVFLDVVVNSSILPSAQMNFEGENNLTQNPIFWNPAAGDFRLQPASPGVNSGNNNFTTMDLDLAGNERIQGGTVDRGCYESDYADECPGDFDSNGLVNSADLLVFLAAYGTVCDQSTCQEDLTGDGTVNVADLLELLGVYGNACDDLVNQ